MKRYIAMTILCLALPAAHADLFISNPQVNFANTPVNGYGKTTKVFAQNQNSTAAVITVTNNDCYDNFYVYTECGGKLEQNQACNISIRFQPYEFGQISCSLSLQDSLGETGVIQVTGYGVQPN